MTQLIPKGTYKNSSISNIINEGGQEITVNKYVLQCKWLFILIFFI